MSSKQDVLERAHGSSTHSTNCDDSRPYREIPLTRGYVALVSPQSFERFGHLKWSAAVQRDRSGAIRRVYAMRVVRQKTIYLHRVIVDAPDGVKVDHRDRNTLDCRDHNLRIGTQRQNCCNKVQKISKHGFIGLESQTPGRFRGRVSFGGVTRYTKTFSTPEQAARARDVLAAEMHGDYAVFNFQNSEINPYILAASATLSRAIGMLAAQV